MTDRVFCIGNGESRASIDLIKLRPHGKIYGCNGLYRDFKPEDTKKEMLKSTFSVFTSNNRIKGNVYDQCRVRRDQY